MISREDFASRLKESDWSDGTVEIGDIVAIWIAGVCVYAMVVDIQPMDVDYWFNVYFAVFDRVPPHEIQWKLHWDHLNQNEFTMNGAPVIIVPLAITVGMDLPDSSDKIKKKDWDTLFDDKRDDTSDET